MKKILIVLLLLAMVGCTCVTKDPHDYLPGWSDNRLEFGQSYSLLILVDTDGSNHYFINTIPGWYSTDGAPIDYTVWCK